LSLLIQIFTRNAYENIQISEFFDLEQYSIYIAIITGLILFLFSYFTSLKYKNKIISSALKNLNDNIVFIDHPLISFMMFVQFIIGLSARYFLPFVITFDIQHINYAILTKLIIVLIIVISAIIGTFIFQYYTVILTNNRIIIYYPFNNKLFGGKDILIKNIKNHRTKT